jgi:hypothetical protein
MSAAPSMSGLIERPQWYVKRFPNTGLVAGQKNINFELRTDSDAPFRMTAAAVYVYNGDGDPLGAAGNVGTTLRIARADGSWMQKHLISAQQFNPYDAGAPAGAVGQPPPFFSYFSPLGTNLFYPAGSSILIDQTQLPTVADALVMVVFLGTKLFRPGAVWAPTYPARYRGRPFIGYNLQTTIPANNVPLNIDPDADFVWRAGAQTPGDVLGFGVKFKDWSGKYYMNDFVPADLIFGYDNSQTPGLVYPEIYIPKQQALYFDLAVLP